jgi:hypothetical protein
VTHLTLHDRALSLELWNAAQLHEIERGDERSEGVAQLVTEHREELVLAAVRALGIAARLACVFIETRVLHRGRRTGGELRQDRDVEVVEVAGARTDRERTEQTVAEHQRHRQR